MGKRITFHADYFMDSVGRRRKLSDGAMRQIRSEFADGAKTGDLAEAWGVSTSLIRTITYDTARYRDMKKIEEARREQSH